MMNMKNIIPVKHQHLSIAIVITLAISVCGWVLKTFFSGCEKICKCIKNIAISFQ